MSSCPDAPSDASDSWDFCVPHQVGILARHTSEPPGKKTSSALVHVQGQHKVLTPQAVWELVLFNPILNSIVAILLQWLHLS